MLFRSNANRGFFADAPGATTFSQQANTLAILTDTAPAADQRALMERVLADKSLTQASYYFGFYVREALRHAGIHNHAGVKIEYVDSETLTPETVSSLAQYDAILVPGGFGKRGVEGKILAAQYAREHKVPYLGICLGMQVATIEYARHMAGLEGAKIGRAHV